MLVCGIASWLLTDIEEPRGTVDGTTLCEAGPELYNEARWTAPWESNRESQ